MSTKNYYQSMDRHETRDDEQARRDETRILRMIRRAWPYRRYTVQILTGRRRIRCRFLETNSDGVWSVPEGKYIKRRPSHHHRILTDKARALQVAYIYLMDELAMASWPEFTQPDRDEVWALILKIADMYWTTMPRSQKEYVTQYYREQRLIRTAPAQALRDLVLSSSSFVVAAGMVACVALLILSFL